MAEMEAQLPPHPVSLTGHAVPLERLKLIADHIALLSKTALEVSDSLPLGADASDFARTLESSEG
jgi:hypothetical protein